MSESFFSRWSRRKQQAAVEVPVAPEAPAAVPALAPSAVVPDAVGQSPARAEADTPLPTLEDVQALQPGADVQPFMQHGVAAEVRNAAMKKLFADPHFNVMDGLDIYIEDYNRPDPMPAGMLRKMASAQFLGLVPQETPATPQEQPGTATIGPTPAGGTEVVAQSPNSSASTEPDIHDHPDLQLQPDPAPAADDPGSRPR